jgi:hypothetical protein
LRLLVLSGGILLASAAAGRLTAKVPVRLLIGPGLALVGAGLLLMRERTATTSWAHVIPYLDASSSWRHLIPGMVVAGLGVGLINPPLASTAIGVVEPQRSGMASGINSTFRQVGISTGIALLGALFTSKLTSAVTARTAGTPLASHSASISTALRNGAASKMFATAPPQERGLLAGVARGSFTTALDHIMLVAAIISFAAAVLSFALIRSKDFIAGAEA